MAMAMVASSRAGAAAAAAAAAAARGVSRPVGVCRSPASATFSSCGGGVSRLCSSFAGLAVKARPAISSAPRKLSLATVAKAKTHKAAAKRFKVTGSGKIMRRRAFRQHLLSKKTSTRKRRLANMVQVKRSDYANVLGALPYLDVKGRKT